MSALSVLGLRRNNFRGSLPYLFMQSTSQLKTIILNGNQFEGPVPVSLLNCTGLEVLDMGNNAINDVFPAWLGALPELQGLILSGNLELCGPPLSKQCGTSDPSHVPQPLESDEEDDSYFASGFTWELVIIGYSCGLVVGIVMWSLMFKARKPKWVVEFLEGAFPKKMRRAHKRRLRRQT
ncbi:receptor-like protein 9DC3 [Lycium barbarum]|uniref:receptor-like protein 9DC3 n=1 Tax=Lycium barbarum TaxID=112863 RepID=UPI00293EA5F6|nr:receptor-like protein 9DC3 [Lycium barbarum]